MYTHTHLFTTHFRIEADIADGTYPFSLDAYAYKHIHTFQAAYGIEADIEDGTYPFSVDEMLCKYPHECDIYV